MKSVGVSNGPQLVGLAAAHRIGAARKPELDEIPIVGADQFEVRLGEGPAERRVADVVTEEPVRVDRAPGAEKRRSHRLARQPGADVGDVVMEWLLGSDEQKIVDGELSCLDLRKYGAEGRVHASQCALVDVVGLNPL